MATVREHQHGPSRVLIAGAGVAALETMLALVDLAPGRFEVELIAPTHRFVYRPLAVGEPFGLAEAHQLELGKLVRYRGATHHHDALVAVQPERQRITTASGTTLEYDWLVIATGAHATPGLPGALTFDGAAGIEAFRAVIDDLAAGRVRDVLFAVPPESGWPLALYELALMTASFLFERRIGGVQLTIVTPERAPLELFGDRASHAVRTLLNDHGVALRTETAGGSVQHRQLVLDGEDSIAADRVVTLPRLRPPQIPGLPRDEQGFIPTDAHGRVARLERVYAAGDVTSYPIKQGGLATQQGDAVAEAIAAASGSALRPTPFRPVLRGVLMTGGKPRYLRADRTRHHRELSSAADHALWWPPGKIAGKYLAPYLAARTGVGLPRTPHRTGISIDVELAPSGGE